jgi:twitching motility protein PilT
MHTFDQHLVDLFTDGRISMEEALSAATSAHEVKLMITQRQAKSATQHKPEPKVAQGSRMR